MPREAAQFLRLLASEARLEATPSGVRFDCVDAWGEEVGELSLAAEALAPYQLLQAGACIAEVARLENFSIAPRRRQLPRFDVRGKPAAFRFTFECLTRTTVASRAERPSPSVIAAVPHVPSPCKLCQGARVLDTRRYSSPSPWAAPGSGPGA